MTNKTIWNWIFAISRRPSPPIGAIFLSSRRGNPHLSHLGESRTLRTGGGQAGLRRGPPRDFNAFLKVGEDGRVSCFTGKIEMGQGMITSLAQMLADELKVPLDHVDMVMGDTDLCPWDMGTFGSMTTRFFGPPLRAAAAEAQTVLLQIAAEQLKTSPDRLTAEDGAIFVKGQKDKRIAYAALTRGKHIERHLCGKGRAAGRLQFHRDRQTDGPTRRPRQGDRPGEICGRHQPPRHVIRARSCGRRRMARTLKSADTSAAAAVPGVRIVKEGRLSRCSTNIPDVAENALKKVHAEFDVPAARVDDTTIFDHLLKVAPAGRTIASGGDLKAGETACHAN